MEAERDGSGNMLPPSSSSKQSWEWELGGMTRREQEAARKILVKFKLINEKRKGIPAKLYFSINVDELEKFIIKNQQIGVNVRSGLAENDNQDVRKEPGKNGDLRPSITKNTTKNNTEKQQTEPGGRAKIICEYLIKIGINGVSANNKHFLKLLKEDVFWDQEFIDIAENCGPGQMQFNYILAKIQGRIDDASKIMANLTSNPLRC